MTAPILIRHGVWRRLSTLTADTRGQLSIREYGHQIPVDVRSKDVEPFIERVLNK